MINSRIITISRTMIKKRDHQITIITRINMIMVTSKIITKTINKMINSSMLLSIYKILLVVQIIILIPKNK
jgi:hypothetical protein